MIKQRNHACAGYKLCHIHGMARPVLTILLRNGERSELERRANAATSLKRDCFRAKIILLRAEGVKQEDVAERLGVNQNLVSRWTRRFIKHGLEGLNDLPGRGRKSTLSTETMNKIISEVVRPPPGRSRWSVRTMATEAGVSPKTVHRLWKQNDLKPHLTRTFKISKDPRFEEKFWDVIGLYLHPPDNALVLCCDEKSQCQALERTQPGLPLGVGHIRTRTHDYKRHGTITLFAALSYLEGKIISRTEKRHTHVEWLRFLKQINRETPQELDIHLIIDNYCTHKHEKVKTWLGKHPRFHVHFTPTSSSWMNLIERFFADITSDVVREGSFTSIRQLVNAIEQYLADRNENPKPYKWNAKGEEILEKIHRARAKLKQG